MDDLEPYLAHIEQVHANYMDWDNSTYSWDPHDFPYIQSTLGYKLQMTDDLSTYDHNLYGSQLDPGTTVSLTSGQVNFIGYWLPQTEKYTVALGEQLDHITSIKAEDWYIYKDKNGFWHGAIGINGPTNIGTFEYGKAYEITVDEDIADFHWYYLGAASDPYQKENAEYFTYEEKADYTAIEIEAIDNDDEITEVGVFEGDKCVGASKITEYPVHLLCYDSYSNLKDNELSFQVVSGRGKSKKIEQYQIYDSESEKFWNGTITAGKKSFYRIKLTENGITQPDDVSLSLSQNYPNPFNPETSIAFTLPQDEFVKIEIYNIKGQKVKTLANGQFRQGTQSLTWKGLDNNGKHVASGIYMYKLITKDKTISKKMLMLK